MVLSLGYLSAQVIYVAQDGTGDGSSWQNATGDLRSALSQAVSGDEVWISGGTYTPVSCSPCTFQDRDTRFVLPKGVKLRGGFEGNENSLQDRLAHQGVPDQIRDVFLSGQIETGVDSTRSFTVLESIAPTSGTLIDQIEFKYGLANDSLSGSTNRGSSGALMYVTTYDTLQKIELEIVNSSFDSGEALGFGGGLFIDADFNKESAVRIDNCQFSNNSAAKGGGGLTISSSFSGEDRSTITDSYFIANSSGVDGGGGVLLRSAEGGSSMATLNNVIIAQNTCSKGDGGGLRLYSKSGFCSATIQKCSFTENTARFGGALNIDAGYGGVSTPTITECEFAINRSSNAGAGIYVSAIFGGVADYKIYTSTFTLNFSGESGGAILVNAIEGSSRPLYRDCRFTNNEATLYGGAVYNLGKAGVCSPSFINCIIAGNKASSAGGVYCLGSEGGESSPLILNCVFEGNEAMVGGALYSNGNDETGTAEPMVANTVFYNNQADNGRTLRIIHGRPHLLNCYIDELDCSSLNSGFGGEPICLGGNLFNAADVFDRSISNTYIPLINSPIIDAGNDSILIANGIFNDISENDRFRGMAADIGPREDPNEPILLKIDVGPTSISACEGEDVQLTASIYPPYPTAEIAWTNAGAMVSSELSYTLSNLIGTETVVASASFETENASETITLNAVSTASTSLAVNTSTLPDTLCIDSTYSLLAAISAPGTNYSVEWLDENENLLSSSDALTFSPTTATPLLLKVKVNFNGDCLDQSSREETLNFQVGSCMTSPTRQLIDSETLTAYPNPAGNQIQIKGLPENDQFPVTLYNSIGHPVYSGMVSASNITLNINTLSQGLYNLPSFNRKALDWGLIRGIHLSSGIS